MASESETYGQDWAKVCGLDEDLQLGRAKRRQDHLASVLFHSPLNCRGALTLT